MAITAADVMKLRKMTSAGMMDCKKALEEAQGENQQILDQKRGKDHGQDADELSHIPLKVGIRQHFPENVDLKADNEHGRSQDAENDQFDEFSVSFHKNSSFLSQIRDSVTASIT